MDMPLPLTKEIVLIGGGHTHALVLRKWGMRPLPGARLTLINPGPTAPYTGMLPGFVAGHYEVADLSIDMVRLARFAGARLILGAVSGIDTAAQQITVPGRPPLAYDLASINIGITSDLPALPGFAQHAIPAKPLGLYARRWRAFLAEARSTAPQVTVIGAGVGGVELSLAMAHALRAEAPQITLIDRSAALPGVAPRARAALMGQLSALGVRVLEHREVVEITSEAVLLKDHPPIPSQLIVGVAGARPHGWLAQTGLDLQDGFLRVNAHLQTSDPAIFAAGDCAALPDPRPKAGVFAVREAPTLHDNLRALARGQTQLRRYRPQKSYLKLISLGPKSAVADKWGGRLQGPWVWRWKDRIDRAFMDQFTALTPMAPPPLPAAHTSGMRAALGPKPLCGGCGAKVGGAVLEQMLGGAPGDDAATLQMGFGPSATRQVISTDHLRALTQDPYLMAKIAAVHSLGDVWAMGAAPQAALATVILPPLAQPMQAAWLDEIMAGAREIMAQAGAEIVGGHTSVGAELTIGFTVTGLASDGAPRAPITLAGAQPGDALVLTKPLGSGVIMAAEMQLAARGDWVADALAQMSAPQGSAAAQLQEAHAMTDVTGFGLAGHLMNICRASGVGAELDLSAIPLLEGAEALAAQGIRASLFEANRSAAAQMRLPAGPRADLLFDPQTAGGLLAAVPPQMAQRPGLTQIGRVVTGPPFITVL
jgi:selenide,water dikinase